ncbi:hypothetical protein [Microbacterium sp. H6]|uniref:hypothetical protein n=1 Tax=Microbacterium sp. H6 TaxID=421122 RepID=UPI000DE37926|nr:hypothetical protein [Microbacterium sp. H6]RBO73053.1 hypothetical protein DSP71_07370 [Microbacterium sp. H6]
MSWEPLLSALIAVLGTLGGVALTQRSASKHAERQREIASAEERDARLRGAALDVARLFRKEMDETGRFRMDRSDPDVWRQMELIDKQLEDRFHSPETSELKLAIALIPHPEARERLWAVMRAYAQSLSIEGGLAGVHSSVIVPSILSTGHDVSAAYARGEEPDSVEMKKFEKFTTWPPSRASESAAPPPSST